MKRFWWCSFFFILAIIFSLPGEGQVSNGTELTPLEALQQETASLEKGIQNLQQENQPLEKKLETLQEEAKRLDSDLLAVRSSSILFFISKTFLNPFPGFIVNLSFFAYLFGALSLCWFLIFKKEIIKNLLPFNFSIRPSSSAKKKDLSKRKTILWLVVILFLVMLIALPALSEESSSPLSTAVDSSQENVDQDNESSLDNNTESSSATLARAPVADKGVSHIKDELQQALDYLTMSDLDRALYVIDKLEEGESDIIFISYDVEQALLNAAEKNNHRPIIAETLEGEEHTDIEQNIRHSSLGYYFLKASLYEAAEREGVRSILLDGAKLLLSNDGASLDDIDMNALLIFMDFFAAYEYKEAAQQIAGVASEKIYSGSDLVELLTLLHKIDLTKEYQAIVEDVFSRPQSLSNVKGAYRLVLSHDYKNTAELIIENAVKHTSSKTADFRELLDILAEFASKDRLKEELEKLDDGQNKSIWLFLAEKAASWDMKDIALHYYIKVLEEASSAEDYEVLIAMAEKHTLLDGLLDKIADRLLDTPVSLLFHLELPWPDTFDVNKQEEEGVSLGVWIFAHLYMQNKDSGKAKKLIEETLKLQLDWIIKTKGTRPVMPLNDLYALVYFYAENAIQGLDVAHETLVFQQRLRGLFEEDPHLLSLREKLKEEENKNTDLTRSIAHLKEQITKKQSQLNRAYMHIAKELAAAIAKLLLLLIALHIALARAALAMGRQGKYFRFSIFMLTFLETVGFEVCCTLVMLPLGIFIVLLSQDRLKHHGLLTLSWAAATSPPLSETKDTEDSLDSTNEETKR